MTEDHTDYSLSVRLIDSLVTPPMFKSAAGWITESKHLPEAFRPEPFLLAAVSSPLLQSDSFSCNRAGPHSLSISRPYWGCFVPPPPPPFLMMSSPKPQRWILSSKIGLSDVYGVNGTFDHTAEVQIMTHSTRSSPVCVRSKFIYECNSLMLFSKTTIQLPVKFGFRPTCNLKISDLNLRTSFRYVCHKREVQQIFIWNLQCFL